MSPEEKIEMGRTLEEIEALVSDATPGLWEVIDGSESAHCCFSKSIISRGQHGDNSILEILCGSDADANLVVNAPRLLAIAQEQRAEIAAMRKVIDIARVCASEGYYNQCPRTDDHHIALLEMDQETKNIGTKR